MVVLNTAPPCLRKYLGRSVPPPLKLTRTGALETIITAMLLAWRASAPCGIFQVFQHRALRSGRGKRPRLLPRAASAGRRLGRNPPGGLTESNATPRARGRR